MGEFEQRRAEEREPKAVEAVEPEAPEQRPLDRLASDVGNRALARLARDGAGILPSGRAHPQVESLIATTRGGGQPLDDRSRDRLAAPLGDSLGDVRVHTGGYADSLARAVSARAFTTGADVYFAEGEYQPGSGSGDRPLAHELTHVAQQRGAPTAGPLLVSQPGEPLEAEAETASGDLAG